MKKMVVFAVVLAIVLVSIGAQEKTGKYVAYEDYYIGRLISNTQQLSVDVRALHMKNYNTYAGDTSTYYVIITKPSGTSMGDQVAMIGYQDFLEILSGLDALPARPLPDSDFFERKYVCGNFHFGYGPIGERNALVYYMTIDSTIPNSTVTFNFPSGFKDVFLKAADKIIDLKIIN